jgi:hypothetical protein
MIAVPRVLPDVLGEIIRRQPLTPAKVDFAWRTAVGAGIARISTVRLGRDKTLRVRVPDAHWQQEIERAHDVIHARLARLLGEDLQRLDIQIS